MIGSGVRLLFLSATAFGIGCASAAPAPRNPERAARHERVDDRRSEAFGAPMTGTDGERRRLARVLLLVERGDPAVFALLHESAELRSSTRTTSSPLAAGLSRLFGDARERGGRLRFDLARLRATPSPNRDAAELGVILFSTTFRPPSSAGTARAPVEVVIATTADDGRIVWMSTPRGDFD